MYDAKVTLQDVDWYRYAEHAPHRNKHLINKFPDRFDDRNPPSGMTDKDSADILAYFKSIGKDKELSNISSMIDRVNDYHQGLMVKAGLKSAEQVAAENAAYPKYIPLKGFMDKEIEELGLDLSGIKQAMSEARGKGFSVWYRSKRAKGRHTFADVGHLTTNLLAQTDNDIMLAGKNKVAQVVYDFVKAYPDDKLFKIIDNPSGELLNRKETFSVMIDGKPKVIEVYDEGIKSALMNLGVDANRLGPVLQQMASVNRYLGSVITRFSPTFFLRNFTKDIQESLGNITAEQSGKLALQTSKNVFPAINGLLKYLELKYPGQETIHKIAGKILPKKVMENEKYWVDWAKDFYEHGGPVSFLAFKTPESAHKNFINTIKTFGPNYQHNWRRYVTGIKNYVETTNTAVENGVRLSAYVALVKSGVSKPRAAQIVKNLSVNFNRKGDWGHIFNAFYVFSNATMQSGRRVALFLKTKKGKAIAGSLMMGGYLMAEANRKINEKGYKEGMSEYTKSHNWLIMHPNGKATTIPLPYNIGVFVAGGVNFNDLVHGDITANQFAWKTFSSVWDAYNPMGGGSLKQTIIPSFARAGADVAYNENFMGMPIAPEPIARNKKVLPRFKTEFEINPPSKPAKALAITLNKISGGDEYNPGKANVAPEVFDYMVKSWLGGLGDFAVKGASIPFKIRSGERIRASEIPWWNTFVKEPISSSSKKIFESNVDKILRIQEEYKDLLKEDKNKALKFKQAHPEEFKHIPDKKPSFSMPTIPSVSSIFSKETIGKMNMEKANLRGKISEAKTSGNKKMQSFYEQELEKLYHKLDTEKKE